MNVVLYSGGSHPFVSNVILLYLVLKKGFRQAGYNVLIDSQHLLFHSPSLTLIIREV